MSSRQSPQCTKLLFLLKPGFNSKRIKASIKIRWGQRNIKMATQKSPPGSDLEKGKQIQIKQRLSQPAMSRLAWQMVNQMLHDLLKALFPIRERKTGKQSIRRCWGDGVFGYHVSFQAKLLVSIFKQHLAGGRRLEQQEAEEALCFIWESK